MQVREANATVYTVPGGDDGTKRLGMSMVFFARLAAHDPQFVWWARAAVRDIPSKAHNVVARRLLEWVRKVVKYRYDPLGLEWQQDPRHTLLVDGAGDCNNQTCLIAALALALGYRSVIRFVKADRTRPDEYSHVYALIAVPDGQGGESLVALDTTQAHAEPGWEPPYWAKMDFDVIGFSPSTSEENAFWENLRTLAAKKVG